MAGLKQEVWLKTLLEQYEANGDFLAEFENVDRLVNNDIINLADIGADPGVLINNTTFPVPVVSSTDTNIALQLDRYDTENTQVPDADIETLAYDVIQSHNDRHSRSLRVNALKKALHAIAPSSTSTAMPLIKTSGTDDGDGFKMLREADVLKMKKFFDDNEVPLENRILVLCPAHVNQLALDSKVFMDALRVSGTAMINYFGFKVYQASATPLYTSLFAKVAWGAVTPSGARYCSVAFDKTRVVRGKGTVKQYMSKAENDPINRKTTIGYAMRYIALRKKNEGVGILVAESI